MTPIEQMLRAVAADAEWPATPDLAATVMAQIRGVSPLQTGDDAADALAPGAAAADTRPASRPRFRLGRPLAIAFAVLLLLAATAAAIPGVRDPVLDWLGLRSVEVERVPRPLPQAPGAHLGLGKRTTLAAARSRLGFSPALPAGLGQPTVYYGSLPAGGQIGLVYPRGIVIAELSGHLETRYLRKFLPPGTKADPVTINGDRALWIHGSPHQYAYVDKAGNIHTDSVRTAGNVLLWHRRDLLIRIEGARSKARALAIARSAREAP
jgi:hypothetical protein